MPRKSAAALTTVALDATQRRVSPPPDLPEPARAIWSQLVDSLPGDRFHASDRPLLGLYCRVLHQADVALRAVEKHGAVDASDTNPWVKVAESAIKQCALLSSKLRLCPQTRMDRKVAGPAAREDQSASKPWEPN
jgi:P27 family predicted phage terminase small subunit